MKRRELMQWTKPLVLVIPLPAHAILTTFPWEEDDNDDACHPVVDDCPKVDQ